MYMGAMIHYKITIVKENIDILHGNILHLAFLPTPV